MMAHYYVHQILFMAWANTMIMYAYSRFARTIPFAGFHTGFFEKGGKSSDAPHLPGNSAYYQCFDS